MEELMNSSIFLLTSNINTEEILRKYISKDYNIITVSKNDLMVKLYSENPQLLLVDLDSYSTDALEMIISVMEISYVPVIYVYSEDNSIKNSLIKGEAKIQLSQVTHSINILISQATSFYKRYADIKESYDAIDLLNGGIKDLLQNYLNKNSDANKVIIKLLELVYTNNIFLSNKPQYIWLINKAKNSGTLYELSKGSTKVKLIVNFKNEEKFNFDVDAPNGFHKNLNVNELSDIASIGRVLPKIMEENMDKIINFAGFSIGEYIFLGVNYNKAVSNYDVSIMKSLIINIDLMANIKNQIDELEKAFDYTTDALARAAEVNDDITGQHIKRVNTLSKRIAEELGMDEEFTKKIYAAAQMHDVGKIYVDKNILTKPGKLTEEEFEEIKKHTVYGETIIGDSKYLKMSADIARNHHERYDGTGYPDGKKGEEIPLPARIVFLADIYDALRSDRPYKKGFSHEKTYEIITKGDGRVEPQYFDPLILETFKKINLDLKDIYDSLSREP